MLLIKQCKSSSNGNKISAILISASLLQELLYGYDNGFGLWSGHKKVDVPKRKVNYDTIMKISEIEPMCLIYTNDKGFRLR